MPFFSVPPKQKNKPKPTGRARTRNPRPGKIGRRPGGGAGSVWSMRLLAWAVVLATLLGVPALLYWAGRRILFLDNPHFVIKKFVIRTEGQVQPEEIIRRLASAGIQKGKTNLFQVDLGQLRRRLEAYVLIDHVEIAWRLPDTLAIRVFDREPVAQITRPGGRLLDGDGWILPPRPDPQVALLPIIAPIPHIETVPTGVRVRDEMVQAALHLLLLCRTEGYDQILEIESIQLDRAGKRLFCHLHEHGTFRESAVVVLPVDGMEMALRRVRAIVRERLRGRQKTGYIDATYRINVPVRP